MKWDGRKIEQGKKDVAKTNLKTAIQEALKAGLKYEDLCTIMAKTINEFKETEK